MPRKILDYFKKVETTENSKFGRTSSALDTKIRECRVDLRDVKDEMKNGQFKDVEIVESESNLSSTSELKNRIDQNSKHKCKFCDKKYSTQSYLINHIKKIHSNEIKKELLSCKICDRKFIYKYYLDMHMKMKHPDGRIQRFECDFDGKIYKTKGNLRNHMQNHLASVKCEICHAEIKHKYLYTHMKQTHATDRKFQCKICQKYFKSQNQLKNHRKTHDKKFNCTICDKKFIGQFQLNRHIKSFHENLRSFSCDECDKKFSYNQHLKNHKLTHEKNRQKSFKCQRCDYATDYKQCYVKHIKYHEKQDEKFTAMKNPIKCKECPVLCKNETALRKHMWSVHPKEKYQCDLCGKYIKTKDHLTKHIRLHLKQMQPKLQE